MTTPDPILAARPAVVPAMTAPMATVYVAHSGGGAVLGSRFQPPWLADDLHQAVAGPWRGQPVFRDPAEAFGWLDWARADRFRAQDFAIAEATVRAFPSADGTTRIRLDRTALVEPTAQLARGDPATDGPHPSVLAACHRHARGAAGRTWSRGHVRGRPDQALAADTVWRRAYPLAYRDARTTLAGRVGDATQAAAATLGPEVDPTGWTRRGLHRISAYAAAAAATPRPAVIPDPPPRTRQAVRGVAPADWPGIADLVWRKALHTGALDGALTTAADLHNQWRADRDAEGIRIGGQDLAGWLRTVLAATNTTVAAQWWHATSGPDPAGRPGHPARGFPPLAAVHAATTPATPDPPAAGPGQPHHGRHR